MYLAPEQMAGLPFFDRIMDSVKKAREAKAKQLQEKNKKELLTIAIPAGAVVLLAAIMMKKRKR